MGHQATTGSGVPPHTHGTGLSDTAPTLWLRAGHEQRKRPKTMSNLVDKRKKGPGCPEPFPSYAARLTCLPPKKELG